MSEIDKILEGPFTYDIDRELSLGYHEEDEIATSAKDQPVIALMHLLMNVYNYAVKNDYNEAQRKILEVDELWKNLDMRRITSEKISAKVLEHIKDSTLYYFYIISGNESASKETYKQLIDSREYTSDIELATFSGCRAIGWSSFHEAGHQQALIHAKKATAHCHECPLWYFVLYKHYRISRRQYDFDTSPSSDETDAIIECIHLSIDPFYCLHAGEMYREAKNHRMALFMFGKVYEAKPESSGILLRLAKGMLRCKRKDLAKELLDQVEKKYPNDSMFLQYKGLYLEADHNYEAAVEYFLKAANRSYNYGADMGYASCRRKFDENFDCIAYLQTMMAKYTDEAHTQQLLLHLAMNYLNRADFNEAGKSFVKAIQMDKNSNQLKKFNNATVDYKNVNIFDVIKSELVPHRDSVDPVLMQQLLNLCQ